MTKLSIVLAGALLLAAIDAAAYEVIDVKDGGSIAGAVTVSGPVKPRTVEVTKDQDVCGTRKQAQDLRVGPGGVLLGAVVSLTDVTRGKKLEAAPAVLDQKGCEYQPHVVLLAPGAELKVLNSDGILHNIRTFGTKNPPLNVAQPKFKKEITLKFAQPEVLEVRCDAHEWMNGTVVVRENPYVVATDDQGGFRLDDVPPGDYTLRVWHGKLGEHTQKVTVEAGKVTRADVSLAPK